MNGKIAPNFFQERHFSVGGASLSLLEISIIAMILAYNEHKAGIPHRQCLTDISKAITLMLAPSYKFRNDSTGEMEIQRSMWSSAYFFEPQSCIHNTPFEALCSTNTRSQRNRTRGMDAPWASRTAFSFFSAMISAPIAWMPVHSATLKLKMLHASFSSLKLNVGSFSCEGDRKCNLLGSTIY